jgi:hypothetical protein
MFAVSAGCDRDPDPPSNAAPAASATAPAEEPPPRVLYLPDGGDEALEGQRPAAVFMPRSGRCPSDMVDIGGRFCIDRFEASLVDATSGRPLSPHYNPERERLKAAFTRFQRQAPTSGSALAKSTPIPPPAEWQLTEHSEPRAVAVPGVLPNGYLTGIVAERACRTAGKRLCTKAEWVTACRGQLQRKFPYGHEYAPGRCNVLRNSHPAKLLHNNASINHTDPRLNIVSDDDGPLLRKTGANPACRSEWGSDAVYDMVGNLDEWVDDPGGMFLGGFYSRGTREGCDAQISSHPRNYYDYSLGVRCCM